jgi:hypothetical protein
MKTHTFKNIASFTFGLALTFLLHQGAHLSPVDAQGLPLQVAPARQEVTVDPGQKTAVTIRFFNLSDDPTSGFVRIGDFIVNDSKGTPRILENAEQVSPRFSGASWFTLPFDRMSVAANDHVSVQATINVPSDARPGGRYVAIYFEPAANIPSSVATPQEAGAAVRQRLAALVYIRVSGPITEKAIISRLYAPTFLEYGPINIEADVLNKGDYHIHPQGSIALKNMLNGFVDQKQLDSINIFPDTYRTYSDNLGKKWMMGRYTVEVSAAYGSTGQIINRSIDVWVFPWKIALIVLLALIIFLVIGRNMYRKLIVRENQLQSELRKEHAEIQKLKEELNSQR